MHVFANHRLEDVVRVMRARARRGVFWGGTIPSDGRYLDECKAVHLATGAVIIFTRDSGHHTSGWWKNPDYERCEHLSLSAVTPELAKHLSDEWEAASPAPSAPLELGSYNRAQQRAWVKAFYPDTERLVWSEPPSSDIGKKHDVWHFRVFFAPNFTFPLMPRGEVYSRELTEAGWKSWSDLNTERKP